MSSISDERVIASAEKLGSSTDRLAKVGSNENDRSPNATKIVNSASQQSVMLLDTQQTKDLTNSLKKRRIEIFFRGRYVSVGNNASMKEKINKFETRQ